MTKEEFDAAFFHGALTVHHHTDQEWRDLCNYAWSVDPAICAPDYDKHDCRRFPYVSIVRRCVAAYRSRSDSISYHEFVSIISETEGAGCSVDFEEVL